MTAPRLSALDLLEEIEKRGAVIRCETDPTGNPTGAAALKIRPASHVCDLLPDVARLKPALLAVLELQKIATNRRRHGCFISPTPEFWAAYKSACAATGEKLRFNGRGVRRQKLNPVEIDGVEGGVMDDEMGVPQSRREEAFQPT